VHSTSHRTIVCRRHIDGTGSRSGLRTDGRWSFVPDSQTVTRFGKNGPERGKEFKIRKRKKVAKGVGGTGEIEGLLQVSKDTDPM